MSKPLKKGSRKFAYCLLGLSLGSFFYFLNIYLVTIYPYAQASYITLFDTIIAYVGGLISILTGTHAWMDWKNTQVNATSLANITENINPRREPKDFDVPLEDLNP